MPATRARRSRAAGFKVYWPVSKRTSGMLTTSPRIVSLVSSTWLSWLSRRARISSF